MRRLFVFLVVAGCGGGGSSSTPAMATTFTGTSPGFSSTGDACLQQIGALGGYGAQVVGQLGSVPITIVEGHGDSSATAPSDPGAPVMIEWSTASGTYACSGAPKVPCATLLHELVHGLEYWNGTSLPVDPVAAKDEWAAIKAENWMLAQLGLCQRSCYDASPNPLALPQQSDVLWPLPAGKQQVSVSLGGEALCAIVPTMVTLTIDNQTPDQILVAGGNNKELLCGGDNPHFNASSATRNCSLVLANDPSRNPYYVPLTTLVAYFPSGDPNFVGGGRVEWTNEGGMPEGCGGNAYSEYCQIKMGQDGSYSPPFTLAMPADRTVHVKYATP